MASQLPEHVAEGFISTYIDGSTASDRADAVAALAAILRSAYGGGLVAGADSVRKKLLREANDNGGSLDAKRIAALTSKLIS